ncbi:LCP family protein [Actinokineospora bangkokensis]|uniref:Cell envelope-related transcriptional attenuator domain-containing protein n=1 Tax=Actinokineospora bangkokensis TaxID=1193682 RepID=A0A1Q9LEK9_9PSEU|nr:LCP family protein [Actinokineospora bangkokensis]OLR90445.1 hypothetical protein BJP25_27765 [Actinokineospora bangkokensis]
MTDRPTPPPAEENPDPATPQEPRPRAVEADPAEDTPAAATDTAPAGTAEPQDEPAAEDEAAEKAEPTAEGGPAAPVDAEPAAAAQAEPAADTTPAAAEPEVGAEPDAEAKAEPDPDAEPTATTEPTAGPGAAPADEPAAEVVEAAGAAGPAPRRRASGWLIAGRSLVALVSAAVLAATGLVTVRVDGFQESVTTTDALSEAQNSPSAPPAEDGADDILVVGSDTRTDLQGHPLSARVLRELRTEATDTINTDTLILLRLPKNGARGYAVSIPRDTSVEVPGLGVEKINGAFGVTKALTAQRLVGSGVGDRARVETESDTAGRTALIQAVQGLTGVRVDHYAEVTLYGFYLLTEAIDGVDVCLKRSTSDPDSGADFRAGQQTVRGGDAVSFVRQRKGLPRGDLDRIVRQQTFLASAMNKVLSGGTLTDAAKLSALERAVSQTVVMDPGLHFLDLVKQAQAMAAGQVQFATIPVTGVGARNDKGQSVITVDVAAVRKYMADLATDTPPPAPPAPTGVPDNLTGRKLLDLGAPAPARAAAQAPCID